MTEIAEPTSIEVVNLRDRVRSSSAEDDRSFVNTHQPRFVVVPFLKEGGHSNDGIANLQ